ncbi:ATP-binding cassette domain-containing protein [Wenzhouxiangella sp. AB-CW3]|uniref:ABC transporter ATP-binding protein n=1 Tax=Wenzhouxiangella sp. AB-CW3 TaxID=2771012 RepID=UPI00168BD0AB|nr:ATP-binding cassette domain-containing protein [Wenzhouxiangella sp. AB-CW3]QOC22115.1 ATP-binding cassette domain-containing protein [Wenzhouxiangella sp. AB-CW3]
MVSTPETSETSVVKVRGLRNQFGQFVVHQGLDLDVRRGEVLGIVGGSGSGKSVLMRAILGLRPPQAGTIEVLGERIEQSASARSLLRRRTGVLFQDGALFSSLTVRENVEVPIKTHCPAMSAALRRDLARLKIRMVGLPVAAGAKLPSELSGGMRKRAGLARALAVDPELLFLDEPTAGLDPIGAAAFDELLVTLRQALGLTVFLITHDLDTLYAICDRVAVIGDGRILVSGPLSEVEQFEHEWVQNYFHGPRARAASQAGKAGS